MELDLRFPRYFKLFSTGQPLVRRWGPCGEQGGGRAGLAICDLLNSSVRVFFLSEVAVSPALSAGAFGSQSNVLGDLRTASGASVEAARFHKSSFCGNSQSSRQKPAGTVRFLFLIPVDSHFSF